MEDAIDWENKEEVVSSKLEEEVDYSADKPEDEKEKEVDYSAD